MKRPQIFLSEYEMTPGHDPRRAAIAELVSRVPGLKQLIADNMVENFGDLLPSLFMGDLLPWLVQRFPHDQEAVNTTLDWMAKIL